MGKKYNATMKKKSELIALGVSGALLSVSFCGLFIFFVTLALHDEDVATTFATKKFDPILKTTKKLHEYET